MSWINARPGPPATAGGSDKIEGDADGVVYGMGGEGNLRALGMVCRIKALRTLATNLLQQMEAIESLGPDQCASVNAHSLVDEFEAQLIRSALGITGGHQRQAAKMLHLKANTLNNKMRRHRLHATPGSENGSDLDATQ